MFLSVCLAGVTPSEALGQALPDVLLHTRPAPSSSPQTTLFHYNPQHVLLWSSANLAHPSSDSDGLEQAVIKVQDDADDVYASAG